MKKVAHKQNGFSLIEVMVAVGLLAIVALGSASQMAMTRRASQFSYNQQSRDQASEGVAVLASSPAALYWSAANETVNPDLANCVLGTKGAASCLSGQDFPLKILMPNVLVQATGSTAANAVYIDRKSGYPCASQAGPTDQCPQAAYATFRATCPKTSFAYISGAKCQQAESIDVTYHILSATDSSAGQTHPETGANVSVRAPAQTAMRSIVNTVTVPTAAMALYKPQTPSETANTLGCQPGMVAIGVDGGGNVLCQKLAYQCGPGQITVGLDKFGRPVKQVGGADGGVAQFDPLLVDRVVCVNTNNACSGQLEVAMVSGGPTLPATCFTNAATCRTTVDDGPPPQAFIDIHANYATTCQDTQSCYQRNPAGTEGRGNFTDSIPGYNVPASSGVIVAQCEAFNCGPGNYMASWDPMTGNCSGFTTPPSPPVVPPVIPPVVPPVIPPVIPPVVPPTGTWFVSVEARLGGCSGTIISSYTDTTGASFPDQATCDAYIASTGGVCTLNPGSGGNAASASAPIIGFGSGYARSCTQAVATVIHWSAPYSQSSGSSCGSWYRTQVACSAVNTGDVCTLANATGCYESIISNSPSSCTAMVRDCN